MRIGTTQNLNDDDLFILLHAVLYHLASIGIMYWKEIDSFHDEVSFIIQFT